ncbi:MAG TPA: TetR/AcrR family transcriptional regulator [Solirubrobacterales bacterium]|nr:TetR/AcrR family transcriptional regulator [Solirubrobacterales bacterium]
MATGEGLRALKKQRTRRDIVVATLELTLEDSYRATTIPLIAERAMVSPRTVSAYFPNKDDIAFDDSDEILADLEAHLNEADTPLVDRLRRWIYDREPKDKELSHLRMRAVTADPDLRVIEHRHLDRFGAAVACAAAAEIGADPGDPGPQTFAAAFLGVVLALRERVMREAPAEPKGDYLEAGFTFLEAGLAALGAGAKRA